ncbi:Endonuclease III [Spathaspora sp. JA1]|nr:Endonuclease III [Spathaspora sp. JA1]
MSKKRVVETVSIAKRIKIEPTDTKPTRFIKYLDIEHPNVFAKAESYHSDDSSQKVPSNWVDLYNKVVTMRAKFMAPVDTQGCERMPESISPGISRLNPKVYRFQLLISLMLSSQTKDEVNYDAMQKLQTAMLEKGNKDGLCIEAISTCSESDIDKLIAKVGFHNRKANYIKRTCEILLSSHNGDIPTTIDEITALPGIGPKMGYLLLQAGWGINSGIGVDVHLHRLAQMWGWVSKKATTPEKARLELEEWLPKQYWKDVNPLMVGFGQVVCQARVKNCDVCSLNTMCPGKDRKLAGKLVTKERLLKLKSQRADISALYEQPDQIKPEPLAS